MDGLISRHQFDAANAELWEEVKERIVAHGGPEIPGKILSYTELLNRKLFGERAEDEERQEQRCKG